MHIESRNLLETSKLLRHKIVSILYIRKAREAYATHSSSTRAATNGIVELTGSSERWVRDIIATVSSCLI
jgi:hypothetical protein